MSRRKKVINYLSNKELLREIHLSKSSYCEFTDAKYRDFDAIVQDISEIPDNLDRARCNRWQRLRDEQGDAWFKQGMTNKEIQEKLDTLTDTPHDIAQQDLVFRVMTHSHLPNVINKKGQLDKSLVNFPPFIHVAWVNDAWSIVGKSHHHAGEFNIHAGKVTRNLGNAYMLLVTKFSRKSNWRNYSWLPDFQGQALMRLAAGGLQFDESKSSIPFSYYTKILINSFTHVLNDEKKKLAIKSKYMQEAGYHQSFNDQAQQDIMQHDDY